MSAGCNDAFLKYESEYDESGVWILFGDPTL